jgi:predicted nucleic acid-binding protein
MSAVYLDSGIFIALMSRQDRWHERAVALFSGRVPKWATSVLVISESYSWFLHRMGEEAARSFRQLIDSLTGLEVLPATSDHHVDVARMLDKCRGAKLTYVDASSLAHIERKKIKVVWSKDHHLALMGAQVLPSA